jgi:hypothetical protein
LRGRLRRARSLGSGSGRLGVFVPKMRPVPSKMGTQAMWMATFVWMLLVLLEMKVVG